jgi:hypothetical protein
MCHHFRAVGLDKGKHVHTCHAVDRVLFSYNSGMEFDAEKEKEQSEKSVARSQMQI